MIIINTLSEQVIVNVLIENITFAWSCKAEHHTIATCLTLQECGASLHHLHLSVLFEIQTTKCGINF